MSTILDLFSNKQILTPSGLTETAEKGADSQKKLYRINNVASDGTNISGPIRAFNTLQLKDGKTARFTNDVNNRPFSKIETSNIFLKNTSFPLVNKLKSGRFAEKDGESVIEREFTGLRPLQLLSQPVLYGTDIVKITAKEARSTRKMKFGTYPYVTAVQVANTIQPQIYTPTTLFLNDEFRRGKTLDKPRFFSKLRGTPEQLLLQLALSPFETLKRLTSPNGTRLNATDKSSETQIVVTNNNVGKTGHPTELFKYNTLSFDTGNSTYTKQLKQYIKKVNELEDANDLAGKLDKILNGSVVGENPEPGLEKGYDKKILTDRGFIYDFDKGNLKKKEKSRYSDTNTYTKAFAPNTDARGDTTFEKDLSLGTLRGIERGSDYLNSKTILDANSDIENDFKDKDFVTLKFTSVPTGNRVRFRATISGLTETFTPSWESNKFVGNPFNFYTYNSIERSVTFTFKVFSLNYSEHKKAWARLSFLSSLVYPQSYINKNYVTPPFIKFTLGDMYKEKSAFIESLTYTVDDNSTWEIGLKQSLNTAGTDADTDSIFGKTRARTTTSGNASQPGEGSYILPKVIEVAMTLKIIETPKEMMDIDTNGIKVLYGFSDEAITNNILVPEKPQVQGKPNNLAASGGTGNNVAGTNNASQNTATPATPAAPVTPAASTSTSALGASTSTSAGGSTGTSSTTTNDPFQEVGKPANISGFGD
jgi:hypothetical protein